MYRKMLITMCAALVAVTAGCSNKSRPSDIKTEDTQEQKLLKAVEKNYRKPEPHYELGMYYRNNGLLDRANSEFNIALNCDPVYRPAQAAMVRTEDMLGNKDKAKQLAEIYIDQARNFAEDSFLLGRAFQKEDYEDYSLRCYLNAEKLAPESALLNKYIGYHYLRAGDKGKAESYLRRSFNLNPYQPDVSNELGKLGVVVEVPPQEQRNVFQKVTDPLANLFKKEEIQE